MPANILNEIRENYDYAAAYWRDMREKGARDVRYQVEGPWSEKDLKDRKNRPSLVLDELGQYIHQIENKFRQNPRGVKVTPRGNGADDQTAQIRAAMIREIEYQSKAQQAYSVAGSNMVRRSYGYFKLITDWERGTLNRVIRILPIPNPDVILLDPDAKEPDWSDGTFSFEIERFREKAFAKRFGKKARITSFTADHVEQAPAWISMGDSGASVQVAAYCKLIVHPNRICRLQNGQDVSLASPQFEGAQFVKAKDAAKNDVEYIKLPNGTQLPVVESRDDDTRTVTQYLTNGIEILDEEELNFDEIPIIPMFGKQVWSTEGGVSKRQFLSAPRLALDAYKAYCYTRSSQLERLGQDPKTPYEGYEGQFDTQTDWESVGRNPVGYVEFKAKTTATGETILPLPQRNLAEPQIQQYEIAAEAFRRCVQSAMGGSPLPTAAQRQNEKSGRALDRIEQSSDEGNFHFEDAYNAAIERAGKIMDRALGLVYDTPRDHGLRDEAGEYTIAKINQMDEQGNPVGFHTSTGDHGVTISVSPSNNSQREEANDFISQLVAHPEILGASAPKVVALLVKLKNLGPIGDQIARLIDPDMGGDALPPEVAQKLQQAQAIIQQLQAELQAAKSGEAIKKYTVDEQEKTKRVLGLLKVDQRDAEVELDKMLDITTGHFDRMHERVTQALEHQHQREMADQSAQNANMQAEAQREHEAAQAQLAQKQQAEAE